MRKFFLFLFVFLGLLAAINANATATDIKTGSPPVADNPSTTVDCTGCDADTLARIDDIERRLNTPQSCVIDNATIIAAVKKRDEGKKLSTCDRDRVIWGELIAIKLKLTTHGDSIVVINDRLNTLENVTIPALAGRVADLETDVGGMRRVALGACLGGNLSVVPMPADVVSVQSRFVVPVGFGDACMYARLGGAGSGQAYIELFGGAGLGSGPSVNAFGGVSVGSSLTNHFLVGGQFRVANQAYLVDPTGYTAQNNFVLVGVEVGWRLTPVDARGEVLLTGYVLGGVASGQHAFEPNWIVGPAGTAGVTLKIGPGSINF